jgi:hypothetical protein
MTKKRVIEFTPEEINKYLTGRHTLATLGEIHRAAKPTVSASLHATGRADVIAKIEYNRTQGAAKLTQEQIQSVIERVKNGEYPRDIAPELDVDAGALRYHLKKAGINIPKAPRLEYEDRPATIRKVSASIAHLIPKNAYTSIHSMMTRAMQV